MIPDESAPTPKFSRSPLLDAPPQEAFDRYTRLARQVVSAPVALITLLDVDRQFFLSCTGLPGEWQAARQTPLTHSFCQHVVASGEPLIVEDARLHPQLKDNLAITDLSVIAYLGIPLFMEEKSIGSFCVIDNMPRHWTEHEVTVMKEMAQLVASEIAVHVKATQINDQFARVEAMLNSVADGIYAMDTDGYCTYANARYGDMFGYTNSELIGRDLHVLTHHTHADGKPYPRESCPIRWAMQEGERIVVDNEVMWRRDGSMVPVEYAAFPIKVDGRTTGVAVRITDISARKYREEQLVLQQTLLAAQAEALLDAMLIVNAEGRRLWANKRFDEMWQFPPEVIESGSDERLRKWARSQVSDPDAFESRILEVYANPMQPVRDEIAMSDGRVYDRYGGPVLSTEGEYFGHLWLFREITEAKLAEIQREELLSEEQALRKRLEDSLREREEVLGIVSHDLRNPFATIYTSASVLLELPLDEEQRSRQLQIIRRSAQAGTRLIQDLLDVSRMEAGQLMLEITDVAVPDLINETADLAWGAANEKRIVLEQEVPIQNLVVRADRDRLLQALSNLVGNAIKFTPEAGRIIIAATRSADTIRFSVQDNGSGIEPALLPHIFERYWQAKHARRAGAGLGLAIVRGIVRAHDGEVTVQSEPGRGSKFEIVLPDNALHRQQ